MGQGGDAFPLDSDGASVYRRLHHCRCERRAAGSVAQLSDYAVNKIADTVAKTDWTSGNQRGGYIWHTTGSGKTVSSFKAAQLISRRRDADKVIFLLDRIEAGQAIAGGISEFADSKERCAGNGKHRHFARQAEKQTRPRPLNRYLYSKME